METLLLPFSPRFIILTICAVVTALLLTIGIFDHNPKAWEVVLLPVIVFGALTLLGIRDLTQKSHAVLRNYPISAHIRFLLEEIRPEMRQYFFESEKDGMPFSRDTRALVYQRAKMVLDKRPFGTQEDVYKEGYEWMNHSMSPKARTGAEFRVTIGGPDCTKPYSASVFNISAMSFGALSPNAVRALNAGAKRGGFAHDTGEGGVSPYHRENGGDIIWEIGSGYFGCRNRDGSFDPELFAKVACEDQIKMVELKVSQGAKPGHGGVLPGPKVTLEIAEARGVPPWIDCISPASHSAFSTPIEMMKFIDHLRTLSGGKPTGFKLCIGHPWEWFAIAKAMLETGITPDFVVVDGAEGGTGAAPLEFTDHVGAPLREALLLVHNTLVGLNLRDKIRIGASGKVVTAFDLARTLALGADWCNAARGFMFALGCLQSQSCHTDRCPTGVATQDPTRQRALVVPDKLQRVANFHSSTILSLMELTAAAGLDHPREFQPQHFSRRISASEVMTFGQLYPTLEPGELLRATGDARFRDAWALASAEDFRPLQAAT